MSLLHLLLLALPAFSVAVLTPENALKTWLNDPNARQALLDKWSGPQPSLSSAYNASLRADGDKIISRCLLDVEYMVNANSLKTFYMMDSSTKIPEGIIAQVWTHLGNWDQCVGVREVLSPQGTFNGQMCMVNLYPTYVGNSTKKILQSQDNIESAPRLTTDEINLYLSVLTFRFAECVPSSCSAEDIEQLYQNSVQNLPPVKDIKLEARVTNNDCTTQDRPALDSTDWAAVGILIALGVVAAASTLYDIFTPVTRKQPLLIAFSVVTNGRKLLAVPRPSGDLNLSCLHGLRFLSMAWVILGHRYAISGVTPVMNPKFRSEVLRDWSRIGITNATLSVDTFFVLSGLLVGYLFFKQIPSQRKLNIPLYYIHRYIRLTPVLAMVVLLYATLIFRVGWGPMWTETVVDSRDGCREHWWNTLLYIGNFFGSKCVPVSWYLMIDMQLHWLSPIALYLLVWRPRIGAAVLSALCFISLIANFRYSYLEDLPGSSSAIIDNDERKRWLKNFYFPVYIRFVPYLEGLLVGYYLGTQRFLGETPRKLGFIQKCLAWLIITALLLVPLFTGKNIVNYPGISTLPTAFYNSLHRPAWGLGILGVVYLCASGNANTVNSLLSWYGFQILGRFSFCVYLIHSSLQNIQLGIMKIPGYLTDYSIIIQFFGDLLMSLALGGILSILCESPFIALEKELLGRFKRKDNSSNTENMHNRPGITESLQTIGKEKAMKTN